MRNVLSKSEEEIKTHILCSESFFSENRAVYEKMSKYLVQSDRHIRVSCWISKATGAQAHASACAPTSTATNPPTHKTHTQIYNTYCCSTAIVVS
jgi:hypothetical protein